MITDAPADGIRTAAAVAIAQAARPCKCHEPRRAGLGFLPAPQDLAELLDWKTILIIALALYAGWRLFDDSRTYQGKRYRSRKVMKIAKRILF